MSAAFLPSPAPWRKGTYDAGTAAPTYRTLRRPESLVGPDLRSAARFLPTSSRKACSPAEGGLRVIFELRRRSAGLCGGFDAMARGM
jgi:hypothetical protein